MTSPEEWRPVVGYEGLYEVSSKGRVRSVDRWYPHRTTGTPVMRRGRVLRGSYSNGYLRITLRKFGGAPETHSVHRLVATAFIPNPGGLPVVRHLNDQRGENNRENLAWGTTQDNAQDAVKNGRNLNALKERCPRGHPYSKENTYRQVRDTTTSRICRECQRIHDRERRGTPLSGADDPRHGTVNGYRRHGCRCEPCLIAGRQHNNQSQNRRRREMRENTP